MRDIIMGSNDFDGFFDGGVEPLFAPKVLIEYSGGGFIVAEHILELESPLSLGSTSNKMSLMRQG